MRLETIRDFYYLKNLETRRDETAFLVSSRREILDPKFLDPSLPNCGFQNFSN